MPQPFVMTDVNDVPVGTVANPIYIATLAPTNVLWTLTGADMNSTADQAFVKNFTFTNFVIDKIIVTSASISLTTAVGGIYTAASKGGTAVVANSQAYSALTTSAKTLALTLANTDLRTGASLFLSLTTAQGAAATANFYVTGTALS